MECIKTWISFRYKTIYHKITMTDIKGKIARTVARWSHMLDNRNPLAVLYNVVLLQNKGYKFVEIHDNELDIRGKDYEESFLNWKEQQEYLSLLNPRKYFSLARNKYLTHLILDKVGITSKSELYVYYSPESGLETDCIARNYKSVAKILKQKCVKQMVVKTTESSHGDNVWVINDLHFEENDDVSMLRFDGETLMLSDLCKKNPLIFESVISQTSQMAALNPSSVNTIRFMTTLMPDGSARTIACFIKVGRAGRCVDNAGSGGNVDAAVDIANGRIYNVIMFKGWRNIDKIDCHPDTGVLLDGMMIKNWAEIRRRVENFQQRMPFVKAAGWDIAITDNGPIIVEVNDMWDRTGQLFIGRGWKREIKECYDAWKSYYSNHK